MNKSEEKCTHSSKAPAILFACSQQSFTPNGSSLFLKNEESYSFLKKTHWDQNVDTCAACRDFSQRVLSCSWAD